MRTNGTLKAQCVVNSPAQKENGKKNATRDVKTSNATTVVYCLPGFLTSGHSDFAARLRRLYTAFA